MDAGKGLNMALVKQETIAEQKERFPTEWAMYSEDVQNREHLAQQMEDDRPGRMAPVSSIDAAGRTSPRQTLRVSGSGGAA